jgi:hypothetical protein
VLTDYDQLTMSFQKDGKPVQLYGAPKPCPQESNLHQLQRLIQTNAIDSYLHLQLLPTDTHTTEPEKAHPQIASIIDKFHTLFLLPTSLPPPRPIDHKINLPDSSNPISVRPYRYPHYPYKYLSVKMDGLDGFGLDC